MFVSRILFPASFCIAEIGVRICPREWIAPPEYEGLVQVEWQKLLRGARHPLWDGMYYRVLNTAEFKDGKPLPTLQLGSIRYRYIATLRTLIERHAEYRLDPPAHLSTTSLLRTTDGYYLFGTRVRDSSIDLIGGGVQSDEALVSSGRDIENNLYKEIREEVGIPRTAIRRLVGIGILFSETSNVLIAGHAQLHLSRADVERAFVDRTDHELVQPVFIPEVDIGSFLQSMADYRNLVPHLLQVFSREVTAQKPPDI